MTTFAEREAARIEKLKAREQEIRNQRKQAESAAKVRARKADTRDKIELGGLLRIAFEVEGLRPDDLDTLLGGMMYVVRSIKKASNEGMLTDWNRQGGAERAKRAVAKNRKAAPEGAAAGEE